MIEFIAAFVLAMIGLPILMDFAVKGLSVLTVAGLAALLLHRASAANRHLAWAVGIVGVLILPILSTILPPWRILPAWMNLPEQDREPRDEASQGTLGRVVQAPLALSVNPGSGGQAVPSSKGSEQQAVGNALSEPLAGSHEAILFSNWAISIWLCGAGILLLRLLVCQAGLCLLKSKSRPLADIGLLDKLESVSRQLQLTRKVTIRLSDRRVIPMTWGFLRCHILLPLEALAWPGDRQKAVLLHELSHVRRHDCLTQWLVQLACSLHWFNPLVWVAACRMEAERERACDDFVLSCGVSAPDYAEHVLHIGSTLKEPFTANTAAVAMTRPRGLEGRLRTILDATLNRATPPRSVLILCLLGSLAALLPIAMMQAVEASSVVGAKNEPALHSRGLDVQAPSPADAAATESGRVEKLRHVESELDRSSELGRQFRISQTQYNTAKQEVELHRVGSRQAVETNSPAVDEAQQLLKARDEARVKAIAMEARIRETGTRFDSLGFDGARSARDRELATARSFVEKLAAYDRYAEAAKRMERKIRDEVERGVRPVGVEEIARFERLQAEFELAEVRGRLPASTKPQKAATEQNEQRRPERAISESHEEKLRALQAERLKFKAGKSTLFVLHQLAKDVRDLELQISSTSTQRVATLVRYAAVLRELEGDTVTALDRVQTLNWSEDAEADLLRAKVDTK